MALRRSQSTRTTFSEYVTRRTKYQRHLGLLNVVILLGGLCIIFCGLVLKLTYYMDQLGFISDFFSLLPPLLLIVGVVTFLVAAAGFIFSATEKRGFILAYALLTAVTALAQIGSIFVAMEARSDITGPTFSTASAIINYEKSAAVRARWDLLQSRLRCCGAHSYTEYANVVTERFKCVPDTCCFNYRRGSKGSPAISCRDTLRAGAAEAAKLSSGSAPPNCPLETEVVKHVYVRGCLDILRGMYLQDLVTSMLVYGVAGTVFSLVELTAVFLAFAYAAQISRRTKRKLEQQHTWLPGEDLTAGGEGSNNNTLSMDHYAEVGAAN